MHANFEFFWGGVLENFGGGVRTPLHPPRKSAPVKKHWLILNIQPLTCSASNNSFFGSNFDPKKQLLDSVMPRPWRGQQLEPKSARK